MKPATAWVLVFLVLAACADAQSRATPAVIVTAAPEYHSRAALHGDERFPRGARLMLVRDGRMEPLLPAFAASADASVSFDGQTVLFAGKKAATDPWQIWKVVLSGGQPERVVASTADAIRPLWLPGDRLVYALRGPHGFMLQAAGLDGSKPLTLTYAPGNFVPDDVLRDGRVLFESGFPEGAGTVPELYLVYPDGSGVESVRCDHAAAARSGGREHGREMLSGDIVFTQGWRLARFTSSLADQAAIAAPAGVYGGDVTELPNGTWLLAAKRPGPAHFALEAWKPGTPHLMPFAQDSHRDLAEPVVVEARIAPKLHPSALHPWKTANLLALDARLTRDGRLQAAPVAVRVEVPGPAGKPVIAGTAPVAGDGSFFVKVEGDRPLRLVLLDARSRVIAGERGWFWMRSGEQRICVGCHTGPERAPDNRVPEVLEHSTVPVDATGRDASLNGGH